MGAGSSGARAAGATPPGAGARPAGGAGANLAALRGHNTALVLGLLRDAGPAGLSRLELAGRTGLTPQAVSKITARLRAEGLAAEAGRRPSTGGKPRTVLRLERRARSAVGLHLDRDRLTTAVTDLTGEPYVVREVPLDLAAGAAAVLETVTAEVAAVLAAAGGPVLGVGVAVPGPLDHRAGVLRRVTGAPHWNGFPLRAALAERLGLPVVLDKDTNAAALALALGEARPEDTGGRNPGPGGTDDGQTGGGDTGDGLSGPGLVGDGLSGPGEAGDGLSGPGAGRSFAYLHLGTGLGAGLVLDGEVYRGARTDAGEFGHQVIQLDGPPCGCGNRGCVEALCLAAVADGDPARAARLLGVGTANLVRLLDIDRVLLGGRTVSEDPAPYLRGVREVLAEDARRRGVRPVPVSAAAGPGPGARTVVTGAAQLVLAPLFARGIRPRAAGPGAG
ncbi:ROK family transcriptional regulator [Streptomyces pactum]|uniref:ROK family transcriptional regulator n=1 Tax=Streptomyces pactum TaxID=68249 RepID=UPI0027DB8B12|nr:ROK family transcriptional regulator [Streptomyces pactum]